MDTKTLIDVFNDTRRMYMEDPYLKASVTKACSNSRFYSEDDLPENFNKEEFDTIIKVTGESSFDAAKSILSANPSYKVAVLNFANSVYPGGGVKSGSRAQEESLCRASTLYEALINHSKEPDNYYSFHKRFNSSYASDGLIYTPSVVVFKDAVTYELLPKDKWYEVDVITMAAPDLSCDYLDDEALYACHYKRAIHLLYCALNEGADALILGAIGCGVFNNNPKVVARAYKDAISDFPKCFKEISFAIYSPNLDSHNYLVFKNVFDA